MELANTNRDQLLSLLHHLKGQRFALTYSSRSGSQQELIGIQRQISQVRQELARRKQCGN